MILTSRDKEILKFIECHHSVTIDQTAKIFYKDKKEAYQMARKRLKDLQNNNYIKRYRENQRCECIYYINKKLSPHNLKLMDVYAELVNAGAKIELFKKEFNISTDKNNYRIDALLEFEYDDYFYTFFVEVDYTHFSSIKRFEEIFKTGYMQHRYNKYGENIFPHVLIIRPILPTVQVKSSYFDVTYMNFSLEGFRDNIL